MRGNVQTFAVFDGGVNSYNGPFFLKENEARDARNVVGDTRGKITKRFGNETFVTPPVEFDSLFAMHNPDFLIGHGGNALYSISPLGAITNLGVTVSTTERWEWIQGPEVGGQGPVYGVNGVDPPKAWTGSGSIVTWTAQSGTIPNGLYLTVAANRVWMACPDGFGSRVVWSDIGNPRSFPVENVVAFDEQDGEDITGIATAGPYVVVAKPRKLWVIYDMDIGSNRRVGENVGSVAHRSMVETPFGMFFLSLDQGILRTDGNRVERVSDAVKPFVDSINYALRANACAVYSDQHYYLSATITGSANDTTFDFDTRTNAFWVHTVGENQMVVWDAADVPVLYGAKSSQAKIDKMFVPGVHQDNGSNFNAYWSGPSHTFGTPYHRKRFRQIQIDGAGDINVSLSKDFARTATFQESLTLDDTLKEVVPGQVLNPGMGRALSLTVGNSSDEPFELDSYSIAFQERRKIG